MADHRSNDRTKIAHDRTKVLLSDHLNGQFFRVNIPQAKNINIKGSSFFMNNVSGKFRRVQ